MKVLALALIGCRPAESDERPVLPPGVDRALAEGRSARMVVRLDDRDVGPIAAADRVDRVDVLEILADDFVGALPAAVRVDRTFRNLPVVVVEVADRADVERILARPDVVAVDDDLGYRPAMAESLALVGQPVAAGLGYLGAGVSVAVLDSGADWSQADLGGCSAVGAPCRVVYAADFAADDGVDDDSGHGTNVASVIAAVAPGADLLALDVFDGSTANASDVLAAIDWAITNQATYDIAALELGFGEGDYAWGCSDALTSGIAAAHAAGIAVVAAAGNEGWTDGLASPACNADAVSVGAVYDADVGPMVWSACTDATTAADQLACFSDSAAGLHLLAPGASITAGGLTLGGTSQASAFVAGALAVLAARDPGVSVDDRVLHLQQTGQTVADARNGLSFPRLDLGAALTDCVRSVVQGPAVSADSVGDSGTLDLVAFAGCTWLASSDAGWLTLDAASGAGATLGWTAAVNPGGARSAAVTVGGRPVTITQGGDPAPAGVVEIAGGAGATRTTTVSLALSATDDSGVVTEMCLSNTGACTAWVPYASTSTWTLASGAGTRTVSAWFRDANGNTSDPVTDTITLDATLPTNGAVTATTADSQATVSWSGYADPGSGVVSYLVMQATGSTAPSSCVGTPAWSGSGSDATLTGLVNGTTYAWRVCAVDAAGNVSSGATTSLVVKSEFDPPVGAPSINAGAALTSLSTVTVTLAATDASPVTEACLSNSVVCLTWFPMTATQSWTLVVGAGVRTVFAQFKDANGNVSAPVSDTIVVDTTKPANGTVAASGGTGTMTLSWSGFTDLNGITGYTAVYGATLPATCADGTVAYTGSATTVTVTGLTDGAVLNARVCATDGAGNVGTGATTKFTVAPEHTAPTGTVTLAAGAAWTNQLKVNVTPSATDPSGVAKMCLSSTAICTAFVPYTTATTTTVTSTAGTKTLYATYQDPWGNTSAAVTDTIGYDATAPTNGTVTAVGGDGQVQLTGVGSTDATSGIASYKVVYATTTAPTSCSLGTVGYTGASPTPTITGLTNGLTYGFRLCTIDNAGNSSAGTTVTARPAPEYAPPTGAVVANAGDAWTHVRSLNLDLTATDASGVAEMCVSATTTCTAWKTFAATATLTPSTGDGTRYAYVWFEDTYGNRTTAAVSDSIGVDSTAPKNGTLTATAATASASLTWTGFSDVTSGLASYKVVYQTTSAPSSCSIGTVGYAGTATSTTVSGLVTGTKYGFRVCALDVAGNVSNGATGIVTAL